MTKQTKALKLALEALEGLEALLLSMGLTHLIVYGDAEKAITALQEALASEAIEQPAQQQELVAWMHKETGLLRQANKAKGGDFEPNHWTPLYTSPPAQRKPLTDEVKHEFWIEAINHGKNGQSMNWQKAADFYANAIEAAHGIGEKK